LGLFRQIAGIINGTTNFMLTAMTAGATYGDILKQAQDLGYAEGSFERRHQTVPMTFLGFFLSS
jgi:hypothetical protein